MRLIFDSFWRAAAYCLHPRVIGLSLAPLLVMATLALGLGYFFWEPAIDAVRRSFEDVAFFGMLVGGLESLGLSNLRTVLAPLLVVCLTTPVIVLLSLLLVAAFMTPAMVELVARRRFPRLERRHGGSTLGSVWGALWTTLVALVALAVSIPFWFVPPLVLVLPPLIWGWLTYRVMSYDVLAEHADAEERRLLTRRHRASWIAMGVLTGYLGAAPSLVFASGAFAVVLAPVLVPVAVWIYTLVFAFSALWFAHHALAALQTLRGEARVDEILPPASRMRGHPTMPAIEDARIVGPSDARPSGPSTHEAGP